MTEIRAVYYDGRAARRHEVTLHFDHAGDLEITGLDRVLRYPFSQLRISSRLGATPRHITLPDGGKCETAANEQIDALLAARGAGTHARLLHAMESRWPWILALFVLTAGVVWTTVKYGVPDLARRTAFALPVSADQELGKSTLQSLDKMLLAPSKLDAARKTALQARFGEMVAGLDGRYRFRLELRASPVLGPNALALPDGTIVLTDELVRLAERDEELLAVMAHEIGHVVHRHSLRGVLQSSAVGLLVAFAMGDVMSLTSLAAALPTMLVEAKFSRDFEREADEYALHVMRSRNISPQHAAAILTRLAERTGEKGRQLSYLSSHPGTEERARLFSGER
jgi:Zn-dependent protease with chaperone function